MSNMRRRAHSSGCADVVVLRSSIVVRSWRSQSSRARQMTPWSSSQISVLLRDPGGEDARLRRRAGRAAADLGAHGLHLLPLVGEQRDQPGLARLVANLAGELRAPVVRFDDVADVLALEQQRVGGGAAVELLPRRRARSRG
jgi:hypothetical protein